MNGIIRGNSPFLIKRRVDQLERIVREQGWTPTHVQGSVAGSAESAVAGNLFFGGKQVLFIWDPAKDISGIQRVVSMTDDKLIVFLIHMGTAAEGKKLKKAFPLLKTETHDEPEKQYKKPEFAAEWAVKYAKELGASLDGQLATGLVKRVGSDDLGFIRWEIYKANLLRTGSEITAEHVRDAMAPICELQPTGMFDAIGARNEAAFLRAAAQFKRSGSRDDAGLIQWVSSTLTLELITWAAVLSLVRRGVPSSVIAERLHLNKWVLENKILPKCRKWTEKECQKMLAAVSDAEQSIYRGAQSPWTVFVSRMSSCFRVEGRQ